MMVTPSLYLYQLLERSMFLSLRQIKIEISVILLHYFKIKLVNSRITFPFAIFLNFKFILENYSA